MVLSQIAITAVASTRYYVGVSGKCKVKILDLKYMDSTGTGAGAHDIMIMTSSVLNFPNSTRNGLIFTNKADHTQFTSMVPLEIEAILQGYIDLAITQFDGTAPVSFEGAVVTLDIIPMPDFPKVSVSF